MNFKIFQNGKEKKEWHRYKTKQGTQFIQILCTDFDKAVELAESYHKIKPTLVQVLDETDTVVYEVKQIDLFSI